MYFARFALSLASPKILSLDNMKPLLRPFPYQGNSNVFRSVFTISGFAENKMHLGNAENEFSLFFLYSLPFKRA